MARKRTNYDETLERYLRTALLYTWRRESIEKCDNKCAVTGKPFEVVHHLFPCNLIIKETMENLNLQKYNAIKDYSYEQLLSIKEEYVRLHYTYGLGVCLTSKIHNEFHSLMGLNAKPKDFELYKHYKINNLDLTEIAKCDLSDKSILSNKIKIYKEEIKYILEKNDRSANDMHVLFVMLILSKIYKNKEDIFYASAKMIQKYSYFKSANGVASRLKALVDKGMIEKIKREEYYKGLDVNYLKLANAYKVNFTKDISYGNDDQFIIVDFLDFSDESFYDILMLNFDKLYLKNVLPKRKYNMITKKLKETK